MAQPAITKRMAAQFRNASERENHPNLLFLLDDQDARRCYILAVGLPYPYRGAEVLFQLDCPDDFPKSPPALRCLTPNGVYELGCRICISIGEYHAHDASRKDGAQGWRPALGLAGFARETLNGLLVPEVLNGIKHADSGRGGIGILDTPATERAELAAKSHDFNLSRNSLLLARFESAYMQDQDKLAAASWRAQRAQQAIRACCGPADVRAAFPDLVAWVETKALAPEPEEFVRAHAAELCKLDSAATRRGRLLAELLDSSRVDSLPLLCEELPAFRPAEAALRAARQAGKAIAPVLCRALAANDRQDFVEQGRLLGEL